MLQNQLSDVLSVFFYWLANFFGTHLADSYPTYPNISCLLSVVCFLVLFFFSSEICWLAKIRSGVDTIEDLQAFGLKNIWDNLGFLHSWVWLEHVTQCLQHLFMDFVGETRTWWQSRYQHHFNDRFLLFDRVNLMSEIIFLELKW